MTSNITASPLTATLADYGQNESLMTDPSTTDEPFNSSSWGVPTSSVGSRSGTFCPQFDIPNIILLLVYIVLGLGNWITILSFIKNKIICRPYNWFMFGMAIPDGITTTIIAPMALVSVLRSFKPISEVWCFFLIFVRGFTYVSSGFFVLFIGITRISYAVKKFPTKFTNVAAVVLILVTYAISTLLTVSSLSKDGPSFNLCMAELQIDSGPENWLPLYLTVVVTYIAFCIIYVVLVIIVRNRQQATTTVIPNAFKPSHSLLSARAALSVAVVFGISSLLPGIPGFIQVYPSFECHLHYIDLITNIIFMQSALNPLLYVWQSALYRKQAIRTVRWLLRCCRCRSNAVLPQSSVGRGLVPSGWRSTASEQLRAAQKAHWNEKRRQVATVSSDYAPCPPQRAWPSIASEGSQAPFPSTSLAVTANSTVMANPNTKSGSVETATTEETARQAEP